MKKKILFEIFILPVLIFLSGRLSFALFFSKATVKNISFQTAIWGNVLPPVLKAPEKNFLTSGDIFFEWFKPNGIFFEPETYILEIYDINPDIIPLSTPFIIATDISGVKYPKENPISFPNGKYFWKVKTVDARGKQSLPSEIRMFEIDKIPPQSVLSVENSPRKIINEQIPFGNFEKYNQTPDLQNDFFVEGAISLWKEKDAYQDYAFEGNKMLIIGDMPPKVSGNKYENNHFSFSFPNQSKTLSFYYNFFSNDEYPFDDPGFLFRINGEDVLKLNPLDITNDNSTGWKQFFYDISNYEGDIYLDFFAGNSFDHFRQSWIYIDKISTGQVAVNNKAKFIIETTDSDSSNSSFYCIDECESENKYISYNGPFSLNLSKGAHNLYFFSKDKLGNKENAQVKPIFFDSDAPEKISDLTVQNVEQNMVKLIFTSPFDDDFEKTAGYECRISEDEINDAKSPEEKNNWWDNASKISMGIVPQKTGFLEEFKIPNLESGKTYFVAVKSFDAAGNYSEISNFTTVVISPTLNPTQTPEVTISPQETATPTPTIVLSETPTPAPTITLTPTHINLLQNGGFEDGINCGINNNFWKEYGLSLCSVIDGVFHNGNKSVLLTTDKSSGYYDYLGQDITGVFGNKKYKIVGFAKKKDEDLDKAEMRVLLYDFSGQVGSTRESNEVSSNIWEKMTINLLTPLPTQIQKMSIRLTLKRKPVTGTPTPASAYFDDISVEEIQ